MADQTFERELVRALCLRMWGTWYTWGGDDPASFDCSGMVLELAQSVGLVGRHEDLTADGLWRRFKAREVATPQQGDWCFWFNDAARAVHVAVAWGGGIYIGAEGGGPSVKTMEEAQRRNAYIKFRPLESRPGARFVNPWAPAHPGAVPRPGNNGRAGENG